MQEADAIPDIETIGGLIKDLLAYVARRSPESIENASPDALGIAHPVIIEGIRQCFGVQVPPSEFRTDARTMGQLCQRLGTFVHNVLESRGPVEERPATPGRLLIVGGVLPELE